MGPQGHAIIADIAQARMSPAALVEVRKLLTIEGLTDLDQVASWADAIRHDHPDTGPWHYVDTPLLETTYDPARDCPSDNCIVAQLPRFYQILADRSAAPAARLEALKWVVHLMGDITQPLHTEDHEDQGGNKLKMYFTGRETNLHALWDSGMIEQQLGLHVGPNFSIDRDACRQAAMTIDTDFRQGGDPIPLPPPYNLPTPQAAVR